MLGQNPGLAEISHSITGGSLTAQGKKHHLLYCTCNEILMLDAGYWMPYFCARAVCATFCAEIAPALIPIFGESFPSECVPLEAPHYGRWKIDPQLIEDATKTTLAWVEQYSPLSAPASTSSSPPYPTTHIRSPSMSNTPPPNPPPPAKTPHQAHL